MEKDTIFYVVGIGLTAIAVILSFLGLRAKNFPPGGAAVKGGLLAVFLIVAGTCTAAVVLAREEQEHRRIEVAEYYAEHPAEAAAEEEAASEEAPSGAPEETGDQSETLEPETDGANEPQTEEETAPGTEPDAGGGAGGGPADEPPGGPGGGAEEPTGGAVSELGLTSPADGSLVFDPTSLTASAGTLRLTYENPSAIQHNVALESPDGELLDEGEVVTSGGVSSVESPIETGDYIFFCSVPGHREIGMEGTLTVE